MQGIELVLIFSLLSSFLSLFSALSSLLCPVLDSRNRILAFSQGIMRPRGRPPRRNAATRHDPGANTPCSELSWGSLSVPFCDLFSLLSSRFSCSRYTRECANPDAVQAVALFSDPSSRLSLRSVHEAIDFAPNCFVLWRHPDPHSKEVLSSSCLHFYLCSISQRVCKPGFSLFSHYLLQYSCTLDGAPHCFVPRRHFDPHPDVVFSSK